MKSSQQSINTLTTLSGTKTEITSSNLIIPSAFQVYQKNGKTKSHQRTVSIVEETQNNLIFSRQSTEVTVNRGVTFNKSRHEEVMHHSRTIDLELANVLEKIFFKKQRYCFQILKQFYLFPDQSESSIYSLSVYDPLVFQEQIIHSLVKIMETRLITNKIWAFLNLKMMPYFKAAQKIQEKVTKIQQRTVRLQKRVSFDMIKIAAEDAISAIQKPSLIKESRCLQINTRILYNENKEGIEQKQKKERKSCLRSNIIQEQVKPTMIKTEPKKIEPTCQSTTKVYTREEYELKYGKMKQQDENYEPKIVRIMASNYPQQQKRQTSEKTTIHTYQTQYRPPTIKIVNTEQKPQVQIAAQQTSAKKEIKSPRKYNIIHYHEKPREISHSISVSEKRIQGCSLNTSCSSCSSCCKTSCCRCQHSVHMAQSRAICCGSHSCCSNHSSCQNYSCCRSTCCDQWEKNDKLSETRTTQNANKFINGSKSAKIIYSSYQNPDQELSELESRIEYLNFLKSLAKQQELKGSLK